jgi:hypothetical protein
LERKDKLREGNKDKKYVKIDEEEKEEEIE